MMALWMIIKSVENFLFNFYPKLNEIDCEIEQNFITLNTDTVKNRMIA